MLGRIVEIVASALAVQSTRCIARSVKDNQKRKFLLTTLCRELNTAMMNVVMLQEINDRFAWQRNELLLATT